MDDELRRLLREFWTDPTDERAAKLDRLLDRIGGYVPGQIQRLFRPGEPEPRVLIVDASKGPVRVPLTTERSRGLFDPFTVKKIDPSPNVVTLVASPGTTIDGAAVITIATQYHAISVVRLRDTWHII